MYKLPITIMDSTIDSFTQAIVKQKDDAIFAEIQHSFGVDLDKDELIRALQYDRGQYEKGYADGKADAVQRWVPVSEMMPTPYVDVLTLRQNVLTEKSHYVGIEYITLYGDEHIPTWSKDYLSWKTRVTHWMPLPEPPKEG